MQTLLILFGMMGIAAGAFHWGSSSDIYIDVKQTLAEWLVEHDILWPLRRIGAVVDPDQLSRPQRHA